MVVIATDGLPATADAVIIGAGIVGAATAASLAAAGRRVCVIDRAGPLAGTTAAGEGNLLVSDKLPGPELALALRSLALWRQFAVELGEHGPRGASFEFEPKGGVVVARSPGDLAALRDLAGRQRPAGVEVTGLDEAGLRDVEPHLAAGLAGGAWYPQDCQVQPMSAALAYLDVARRQGRLILARAEAIGLEPASAGPAPVLVTSAGRISAPVVVNAAGPWGGKLAQRLGSRLPVRPRRGHILVTEPLPRLIMHKVYAADYVSAVASDYGTRYSPVVEATASGPVLIGSSRDSGSSPRPEASVLAELARRAAALFPFLRRVRAMRAYTGFRPASADHLPAIGPDPSIVGLYHATGHEGAGIGLAPATAELIAALVNGTDPPVDPAPFAPARFEVAPGGPRDG